MSFVSRISAKLKRLDEQKYKGYIALSELQLKELAKRPATGSSPSPELVNLVHEAWSRGNSLDLHNVNYGPTHSNKPNSTNETQSYYTFLAGLVNLERCQRIFEVGTYHGGSISAIDRGLIDPTNAKIATVDIADFVKNLSTRSTVRRLIGDANSEHIIKATVSYFDGKPIDLLYLDGDHLFHPTILNVGLYASLLRPRYIVLDDIVLNQSMRSVWDVLLCTFGENALNCVEVQPAIRPASCGFGLIRMTR